MTKPFNERTLYSNIELAISKHEAMQKSNVEETILSSIFSLIPDVVVSAGPDGMLRRLNAPARALWDWDESSIASRPLFSILDAGITDMNTFLERMGELEKTKMGLVRWPEHVVVTTASGELHRFSMVAEPIRTQNGELREVILLLTPPIGDESATIDAITPHQVIDIISDPVFFTDRNMNLVLFNTAFKEFCTEIFLGDPSLHHPVPKQFPAILAGEAERVHDLFTKGVAWQGIVEIKHRGTPVRYGITKIPIFEGESVSHMATILRPSNKE